MSATLKELTPKQTYTIAEVALILGVGRTAAYEAARTGEIPTIKIGKRLLVSKVALERLLAGAGPNRDDHRDYEI